MGETVDHKPTPTIAHLEYDHIFNYVPSFGRYQKQVVFGTNFLLVLVMGFQYSNLVFGYGTPKYQCTTPNVTCDAYMCCENCTEYGFDTSFTSFSSEYNLICDKASLAATIQSCFFGGSLFGSVTAGLLSDYIGRLRTMYIFNFIMVIASVCSYWATNIAGMAVLRFFSGTGTIGLNTVFFVYFMEQIGPSSRTFVGTMHLLLWTAAAYILTLIVYYVQEWRPLCFITGFPGLLLYLFIPIIPRSPRWLLARGNVEEAHKIIMKYGSKTGKPLEPEFLKAKLEDVVAGEMEEQLKRTAITPLDLFKTPKILRRTLTMLVNWFGMTFVSNAFFLYINAIHGNMFVNYALFNIFPIVLVPVSGLLLGTLGRRYSFSSIFCGTGMICLFALASPGDKPMLITGLFIAASSISFMNWNVLNVWMTELYPTVLRTTSFGIVLLVSRVGAIISPYMAVWSVETGLYHKLAMIVFGVVSLVVGLTGLLVPETLFSNMHQTIKETEAEKEYYGMPCCHKRVKDVEANGVTATGVKVQRRPSNSKVGQAPIDTRF